jgi:phosphopantothenoylcysteine decarboxylase/phosphopantothenate--cysteine ligase
VEHREAGKPRIVLGVSGSIAAYKAAEIVRLLRKAGVGVHVVMTPSAQRFVTPLTFGTLTGEPVTTDLFASETGGPYMEWGKDEPARAPAGIAHIRTSREAELIVVAPATGNLLGKVAHGIADEPLSTAILASSVPVLFAPAMNTRMWENAAVQENVRLLRERGYRFVDPEEGDLACGEFGRGKMAEPARIVDVVLALLAPASSGLPRILVTAGRTEEEIDPVRYLSNHSSGKMGIALAEAARAAGHPVTLLHGALTVAPPPGVERVAVRSAREMLDALVRLSPKHPILIMAAAVADYRIARPERSKIASGRQDLKLTLVPNPDLLATIAPSRAGMITVGFALETGNDRARAREKMRRKGCDLMVMNNPRRRGSEFGGDTNEVVILHADGREEALALLPKIDVAREVLRRALALTPRARPARPRRSR